MLELSRIRSRAFKLELYEDTQDYSFKEVFAYIDKHYDYVCIKHDKDIFTEGENAGKPKKLHWHFVVRWEKSARTNTAFAKEIGIDSRWVIPIYGKDESKTGMKESLLYLTHIDELDKYQYDPSEVLSPSDGEKVGKLFKLWQGYIKYFYILSDEEIIMDIASYIKSEVKYLSTARFTEYCCVHGWLSRYKKYCTIINRMLDEHNFRFNYIDDD